MAQVLHFFFEHPNRVLYQMRNVTPHTLGKWNTVGPISTSYLNKTKKAQFTGHRFRFLVFNLIPDVGETLSLLQ